MVDKRRKNKSYVQNKTTRGTEQEEQTWSKNFNIEVQKQKKGFSYDLRTPIR